MRANGYWFSTAGVRILLKFFIYVYISVDQNNHYSQFLFYRVIKNGSIIEWRRVFHIIPYRFRMTKFLIILYIIHIFYMLLVYECIVHHTCVRIDSWSRIFTTNIIKKNIYFFVWPIDRYKSFFTCRYIKYNVYLKRFKRYTNLFYSLSENQCTLF